MMSIIGVPVRDAAALYEVRRAFGFWLRNGFNCANCEYGISKLIDAIDETLKHTEASQQAWDAALGEVNVWINVLDGFALVGGDAQFHTFVGKQRAFLAAGTAP